MDEIEIKKHNFELAKNRLKEFSEKKEAEIAIQKVETAGGFLWLGDHKVTGDEFNDRMEVIQRYLIDINITNNKTIKEFGEIYNALDALDKDYMTSIIASVKAIEKTSNDVRIQQGVLQKHADELQEQHNKLNTHQGEIDKIVDNIKKTVNVLKLFKEKIDGLKHLTDIDRIWSDCQIIRQNCQTIRQEMRVVFDSFSMSIKAANESNQKNIKKLEELRNALITSESKIEDLYAQSCAIKEKIEPVAAFTLELKKITHLQDIDEMWDTLSSADSAIRNLSNEFNSMQETMSKSQEDIRGLLDFVAGASALEHLMEVDDIWKKTEEHRDSIEKLEQTDKIQTDKLDKLFQADSSLLQRIILNERDISSLKEYKEKLEDISHLENVDDIWKSVEDHTTELEKSKKREEEIAVVIQKNRDETDKKIADAAQTSEAAVETLIKRIKYAYLIAGSSAGLAVIELILLPAKVIL